MYWLYACAFALAVLVQPSDYTVPSWGFAAQIQTTPEPDPVKSVAQQAALGGPVILWVGADKQRAINNFHTLISEARKYPNIKHVYLFDELFWDNGQFAFGQYEAEVLQGAKLAREAGLKPIVTILPDVILHDSFKLDVAAFDGIAIDVYPSIRPTQPDLKGCRWGNPLADLLYCSIQKLRGMGFTGQIGYIYQAFGVTWLTSDQLKSQLALQREVIDAAPSMGVDAVMPWGLYLGADVIAKEPYLYPLAGTNLERLVRP